MDPDRKMKLVIVDWESYCTAWTVHFTSLLNSLEFADSCIRCEGQLIICHKFILAAHSQYFRSAFLQNKSIGVGEIRLWELRAILSFMYTGMVTIERHQVASLLEAAKTLWVTKLVNLIEAENFTTFEEFSFAERLVRAQGQGQALHPDSDTQSAVFNNQPMSMSMNVNHGVEDPQRHPSPLTQQNSAHSRESLSSPRLPRPVPASTLDKLKEFGTMGVQIHENVAPGTETAVDFSGCQITGTDTASTVSSCPNFETVKSGVSAPARGRCQRTRKQYSKKVREKALEVLRNGEMSVMEYSQISGITESTLRNWRRAFGNKIPHVRLFPSGPWKKMKKSATPTSLAAKNRTKSDQYERYRKAAILVREGLSKKEAAKQVQVARTSLNTYLKRTESSAQMVGNGAVTPGLEQGQGNGTGNEIGDGRGEPQPETDCDTDLSCNEIKIEVIEDY